MAIETVGAGGAMSYQTVASEPVVKPVQQAKDAQTQQVTVANNLTNEAVDLTVKSGKDFNQGNQDGQMDEKQQEKMQKSLAELNKSINQNTECQFGYHEATKRVTIKIVDKETKEVIREVPPEKTLDMIAKVWELAGLLVDERR